MLDRGRLLERFVCHLLQRHHLSPAPPAICGDEHRRLGVVDPVPQRLRAEAAKDHGVHGADARARQHGDGEFWNQRQIDRNPVAALDAERLHHVGELADLAIQVEVGQRAPIPRLTFPDERGLISARAAHMTVDAVDARIQSAADEPFGVRRRPVEDLGPFRIPLQLLGKTSPEPFGIAIGTSIDVLVADRRLRLEF